MRALIQSILPEAPLNADGKFNGDVVEKLTEKLSQLVGPEAVQDYKEGRNERGEVCSCSSSNRHRCLDFSSARKRRGAAYN